MAEWTRNKVDPSEINNGNELTANDQVALQELNAIVNAGLYGQDFAEHLADTPDTSNAGLIGTPNVEIIDNEVDGITYKKFKFSNLKGELGDFETGTITTNKVDYTQDAIVDVTKRIDGDTNYLDFTFTIPTDISILEAELTERAENAEASATSAQASATASATSASNAEASANTAVTTSNTALTTAQTAETNSAEAVSTANTALTTAQTAENNSSSAVTTAEEALAKITGAIGTAVYTDGVLLSEWNTEEKAGKIVTDASTGNIGEIFNRYEGSDANTASGNHSHAEGYGTKANNECAHAEGYRTTASGNNSHAEGRTTTASGNNSHAEGFLTTASGEISHAGGWSTTADQDYQTAIGKYNKTGQTGSLFAVGNGTVSARSTAFEVFQDGSIRVNNKYVIKYTTQTDTDDDGNETTTDLLSVAPVDASSSMSISLNGGLITYDADTDTFTI